MTVRFAPVGHTVLANSSHDVRNQVEVLVDRQDRAFADHGADAVIASLNDVRQFAGSQRGGNLRAVVVFHAPVDGDVGAGHLLNGREVEASVKLGRIAVEVYAHTRNGQAVFKVQGFALGQRRNGVQQLLRVNRNRRFRQTGTAKQHGQGEYDSKDLLHGVSSFYLFSQVVHLWNQQSTKCQPFTEPSMTPLMK